MKLRNSTGSSFGWAGIILGVLFTFAPACGGTGDTGGGHCTPNEQQSCKCSGGKEGFQECNSDGTAFSACDCGGDTGGTAGASGSAGTGGSMTQSGACPDGIEQSGECDPSSEFYCPQDCMSGSGGSGGTGTNTCMGMPVYAGTVAGVISQWGNHPQANGKTGFEAGVEICKTIGADHPCEYQEVKAAEAMGAFDNVAVGTTAWIHRTTPEMVNGMMSPPGPGGRCNDWTYATNHISDGEFVTFDLDMATMKTKPAYHLDNDTFYDGVDTTHTITGDLQCGGTTRNILCCFPVCVP